MSNPRVLVVDDEESLRHMLSLFLSKDGFQVWTASSGREALETLRSADYFDVCVSDVRMPGMDGLAFIQEAQVLGDRAPTFVAMSAYGDKHLAIEALRRGAFDYISKPFEPAELSLKLRLVVERKRLSRSPGPAVAGAAGRRIGPTPMSAIVTNSPEMQTIARIVQRVAAFPTTVLITGETGTGKERIAGAIHAESKRAQRPFVAVNCGAIPENLLESELFGHVKGAFTDAHNGRVGLFEAADGGTLFLDEIAELPVHLQVKLLRVLVEHEIRPLGAQGTMPVDVRVVAATSRDLRSQLRDGKFREDLFHRLNVVPIHVPALRHRPSDVRPLAVHFCASMALRFGLPRIEIGEEAIALLERYPWPGNVRELENVLERAFVLSEATGRVTEADLDERFADLDAESVSGPASDGDGESLALRDRLAEVEKQVIRRALERTSGNRSRAAVVLGISHRALLYKLKEHDIT